MRLIDADALYQVLNAIRKQEVLLHGRQSNVGCCTLSTALHEISVAPTIEPKPQWIPCRDKPPEESTDVLVTRKFLGVRAEDYGWNPAPPSTYVEIACLMGKVWVSDSDEYKVAPRRHTDPIAWMPLPDPYMEEEE